MKTYDRQIIDSTGAFMVGELEKLDKTLHLPLNSVTWGRDIDLREDVTIGDEYSSFTRTDYAIGGINGKGKNFVGKKSNTIQGIELDIAKEQNPLYLWATELAFTLPELASASQIGRPLDSQKHEAMRVKWNMDIDEMVYVGDAMLGKTGLINDPSVEADIMEAWTDSTEPSQILDYINALIENAWKKSAYTICPDTLLLPPAQYAKLTKPVTLAGSKSILQYIKEECISNSINGKALVVNPLKWLTHAGEAKQGRALCYTKKPQFIRYSLVPLQHTPVQYQGIYQATTYYGRLGCVEIVYPETVGYIDIVN